jgi:hypothetical protein
MATDQSKSSAKKSFRALTNILGEPVTNADAVTRAITPHKLYRKGSKIELSEKDSERLLKIGSVAPIK